MKDLAQKEYVLKLLGAGVSALKIEGRKKNALYVAAVTDFYRTLLSCKTDKLAAKEKEKNMQMIFARPWTNLYLNSAENKKVTDNNFVGHRGLFTGTLEHMTICDGDDYIEIVPAVAIGLHDGIQIDVMGREKPYGFAIEAMKDGKGRFRMTAEAGKKILLKLPDNHPYLPEQADIYIASSTAVKGAYDYPKPKASLYVKRTPIDVNLKVEIHKITAVSSLGGKVELSGEFAPASHKGALKEAAFGAFAKTGDTPFILNTFTYHNPEELFIPVSLLNDLRRQLYAQSSLPVAREIKLSYPSFAADSPRYILKTDNSASLSALTKDDWQDIAEVIIEGSAEEITGLAKQIGEEKIRIALPPICRYWENEKLSHFIRTMTAKGYKKWEISNLSGLKMLPLSGLDFTTDWSIYAVNRESANEILELKASRFTLSPEDSLENIRDITQSFGAFSTFILYQDTPLFISDTVPEIPPVSSLHSADGNFRGFTKNGRAYIINEKPLSLASGAKETGAGYLRADFILRPYTPEELAEIWHNLKAGKDGNNTTQGNFIRGF